MTVISFALRRTMLEYHESGLSAAGDADHNGYAAGALGFSAAAATALPWNESSSSGVLVVLRKRI
jgi:hypothetical protein